MAKFKYTIACFLVGVALAVYVVGEWLRLVGVPAAVLGFVIVVGWTSVGVVLDG